MNRSEYNKIFDNGVKHIECAKILANKEMFGFAISHLVLGLEELMKYIVVMTKAVNNYDFGNVLDLKKSIFNDHKIKHKLYEEFQEAISDEFSSKFLQRIIAKEKGIPLAEDYIISKNRFKEWGLFFNMAGAKMNIPKEEINSFFEWLDKANDFKKDGFYVNKKDEILKSPENFLFGDYETALGYTSSLLKQTEFMKSVDLTKEECLKLGKEIRAKES